MLDGKGLRNSLEDEGITLFSSETLIVDKFPIIVSSKFSW
jgi:hypothetical protein